jgi:hypothetical protein
MPFAKGEADAIIPDMTRQQGSSRPRSRHDPTIVAAIIGAFATVVGTAIGAFLGNSGVLINILPGNPTRVIAVTPSGTPYSTKASTRPTTSAIPTITESPAKPSQFLAGTSAVNASTDSFSSGDGVIDKRDYANSIWGCFDLREILDNCDNSRSAVWEDYNVPAGYNYLEATIGFSDDSPSACDVTVQIFGDSTQLFNREIVFGDSIPVRFQITNYFRLRFQIIPVEGGGCTAGLGDAQFTS